MIRTVFDTNPVVAAIINPNDDKFFVAAVEGEADYIVTKEQAWKKLKTYRGIRIVSPSKFYEILKKLKKG